ncbi:MAG: hypothetical protein ACXVZV_02945 [Terriglobales bacterium]
MKEKELSGKKGFFPDSYVSFRVIFANLHRPLAHQQFVTPTPLLVGPHS